MHLTSSDHNKLEKNKDGRHHFRIFQVLVSVQLLAVKILEQKEEKEHEQTPNGAK